MNSISYTNSTAYNLQGTSLDAADTSETNDGSVAGEAVAPGVSADDTSAVPAARRDTGYGLQQMTALFQSAEGQDTSSAIDQLKVLLQKLNAGENIDSEVNDIASNEADLSVALKAIVQLMQSAAIANSSDETPIAEVDTGSFLERLFDIFKKKQEQAQQEAVLAENPELVSVEDLRPIEA